MQNFQDTFETRKHSNISDLLISMTLTLNQEKVDIRIALNCSEGSKLVLVKAKDTDILILIVHVS